MMTSSRGRVVAALSVALVAAGCGGSSSGGGGTLSGSPTTRTFDEHANNSTVDVQLGDTVVVVLHSTYWTFTAPPTILQELGAPQPSTSPCAIPGGGCGTVTASFNAAQVGTVTVHAHRDSCGEARRCTGTEGDWALTVRVS